MAGPVANHPKARRRRNRKKTAAELAADGQVHGPELPTEYVVTMTAGGPLTRGYGPATRQWWESLRRSPHAAAYQDTHWRWLLLLAPLFDRWVELGDLDAFKELRLQAPPFGLRPSDANKLDWTIDPAVVGPSTEDEDDEAIEAPPRSGPGSGRDAWAAYATSVYGIDVEGMTRGDIFDAVDRAKGRPSKVDPRLVVHEGGAAAGA